MEDFCSCCGVELAKNKNGFYKIGSLVSESNKNFLYGSYNGKKLCVWCANSIPNGIADVSLGTATEYKGYTKENYKEYPELAQRIKEVMVAKSVSHSCPSCGGEMKDKYSEYVGGNIKKCSSCGWC